MYEIFESGSTKNNGFCINRLGPLYVLDCWYLHILTPGKLAASRRQIKHTVCALIYQDSMWYWTRSPNSVWLYYVVINIRCPLSQKPSGKVARLPIQFNRNRSSMTQNELFPHEKYPEKLILSIHSWRTVWIFGYFLKKAFHQKRGFRTASVDMIYLLGLSSSWSPFPLGKPVLNELWFLLHEMPKVKFRSCIIPTVTYAFQWLQTERKCVSGSFQTL